jgi:hypothetical protein
MRDLLAAAAVALLLAWGGIIFAAPATHTEIRTVIHVPTTRWVAECQSSPVTPASVAAISTVVHRQRIRPRRASWLFYRLQNGKLYVSSATVRTLGERVPGWTVYTGTSPAQLKPAQDAQCRFVGTWASAWTGLAPAAKSWLLGRSTVCGVATRYGRTFASWPGRWEVDPPDGFTVTSRTGFGPGVVGSDRACAHLETAE